MSTCILYQKVNALVQPPETHTYAFTGNFQEYSFVVTTAEISLV